MKFTILKQDLLRELTLLLGVVEAQNTIPVLAHILIEAIDKDSVSLVATDLDTSLRCACVADVQEAGAIVLPARKLFEIVEAMPDLVVVFTQQPNNDCVVIRSGCANFDLLGIDTKHFPATPQAVDLNTALWSPVLNSLIKRTIYAITEERSRYSLDGAMLMINEGLLQIVATDGHRLAIASAPWKIRIAEDAKVLVQEKALALLAALTLEAPESNVMADFNGDVQFGQDTQRLYFKLGQRELSSRKMSGNFPVYESVMPKNNTKVVTFKAAEFTNAVTRATLMADSVSQRILIKLSGGGHMLQAYEVNSFLTVSAYHDDFGKSEEAIACDYVGDPVTMAFKANYLIDFLATITDERLTLAISPEQTECTPVILKPEGDPNYTYILMPMRH